MIRKLYALTLVGVMLVVTEAAAASQLWGISEFASIVNAPHAQTAANEEEGKKCNKIKNKKKRRKCRRGVGNEEVPEERVERSVSSDYLLPMSPPIGLTPASDVVSYAPLSFESEQTERYVIVHISDDLAENPYIAIYQEFEDGGIFYGCAQEFAGMESIPQPGSPIIVDFRMTYHMGITDCESLVPTQGTITLTLSNLLPPD